MMSHICFMNCLSLIGDDLWWHRCLKPSQFVEEILSHQSAWLVPSPLLTLQHLSSKDKGRILLVTACMACTWFSNCFCGADGFVGQRCWRRCCIIRTHKLATIQRHYRWVFRMHLHVIKYVASLKWDFLSDASEFSHRTIDKKRPKATTTHNTDTTSSSSLHDLAWFLFIFIKKYSGEVVLGHLPR